MDKTTKKKSEEKKITALPRVNPLACGIDVSDKEMMIAYPQNSEELIVESFGTFTCELNEIAKRLEEHKITTVAMESTGVYWIPLFLMLQDAGFEVYLVNASHVKNVSGRKDDESDAEWIQKLHTCGLLWFKSLETSQFGTTLGTES